MELKVGTFWAATGRWMCKTWWHRHESQLYRALNVPYDQKVPKKPRYLKILKSINFVSKKEYKVILRVWGQGMWLHESESNSIITEAYENKIFPTIIYISNNSRCRTPWRLWTHGAATLTSWWTWWWRPPTSSTRRRWCTSTWPRGPSPRSDLCSFIFMSTEKLTCVLICNIMNKYL